MIFNLKCVADNKSKNSFVTVLKSRNTTNLKFMLYM